MRRLCIMLMLVCFVINALWQFLTGCFTKNYYFEQIIQASKIILSNFYFPLDPPFKVCTKFEVSRTIIRSGSISKVKFKFRFFQMALLRCLPCLKSLAQVCHSSASVRLWSNSRSSLRLSSPNWAP